MPSVRSGKVYLIGCGPGDIELLTLKAVRCIGLADVILLDSLVNPEVLKFASPQAKIINVGKRAGQSSTSQEWIEQQLISLALEGTNVARLKGGDPIIFARGGEELEALLSVGIEVEVVSGITAGIGVPAALGIPLTHREHAHQVILLTGTAFTEDDEPALPDMENFKGTLVIYMGFSKASIIADSLLKRGMAPATPVAAVQCGTTDRQKTVFAPLDRFSISLNDAQLTSPVLIIVGEVVRLSPHYLPEGHGQKSPKARQGNEHLTVYAGKGEFNDASYAKRESK